MLEKHEYLSYHEIHKQYESLEKTLAYISSMAEAIRDFFEPGRDILFVACGSSYWMSLSAHLTVKLKTGRRTAALKAGDIVTCPQEMIGGFNDPIVICPSRSGRTSEVLMSIRLLGEQYPNLKVLSIIEYADSPLEKLSDLTLHLEWANEVSVCQTRSFSNLYLASVLIAAIIGDDRQLFDDFADYLQHAPILFEQHEAAIERLVSDGNPQAMVSLGCGRQYGVCIEGAYIVTEMAEFSTNYYQLLEYRHGPIVTAAPGTYVFILSAAGAEAFEMAMAHEAEQAGAVIVVVSASPVPYGQIALCLDHHYPKEIVALHYVFCMQSVAFHYSVRRGKNPDRPGNLVPFIEL